MSKSLKKIALISSQYLFRDPRYLLFAKAYQKAGFEVICINLLSDINAAQCQTELFKNFACYTILGKVAQQSENSSNNHATNSVGTTKLSVRSYWQKFKFQLAACIDIKIYTAIIKTVIILKEQFIRPCYLAYLHHKTKSAIQTDKFVDLIADVDILHGCELLFGCFAAGYTAKKYNKKFIFDAKEHHRYMVPEFSLFTINFIKKYEAVLFDQADIISCVSEPIITCYGDLYPQLKNKFIYLPNCQALMTTPLKHVQAEQFNKLRFVVLATYLPFVRGIEYLIEVWNKLSPDNAELYIYLSNLNTITKSYLFNLAANTQGKSLFIMPPVSEDKINATVAQYDVGIIPYLPHITINHLYCCPNKFGQYLAGGLVILSSDTVNIPSMIHAQQLGYVYSTNQIDQAVDCFKQVITASQMLESMKYHSGQYYQNTFNWDYYSLKLINKIKELD